ncbi:MAG: 50S ribosomal protein L16 [Akkermansia sp.]|jgi:large subunit ribosomal protein L16|nr:50S ribosomal protein L16 [Akkermansia sp.]MBQ3218032.1 50S ribosomal protein L16 [Akkermansia sp.]MBQ8479846.1 50S ribosomal protein L16 [Akkermansia sp.]MBR2126034.1 50S ribosomal protein L16 [Akkermansia sp.]MBR3926896.1 50S ribosomal protein L16 [Akkermansia sp.]
MPLMPKRVKDNHRKMHRGNRGGNATSGDYVAFGDFGLQVLTRGWVTNNQIEACRIAINRYLRRRGRVYIRIFPQKSFTKRPPDTRMGKGKGAVEGWIAVCRPGNIMFEVGGVTESAAREALRLASNKLGIRTRFVYRQGVEPQA